MKTLPLPLHAVAIFGSFAMVAAARTTQSLCENELQYIRVNGTYAPVSSDYVCLQNSTINPCTYYVSNISPLTYTVCQWGVYLDLTGMGVTSSRSISKALPKH